MALPFGRRAGSTTKIVAAPTTAGSSSAATSIASRSTLSPIRAGAGTAARRNAPTYGSTTPTTATAQTTDPKVTSASTTWRSCGTRPNSRIDAQPSVVVSSLPANRPSIPNSVARTAIGSAHFSDARGVVANSAAKETDDGSLFTRRRLHRRGSVVIGCLEERPSEAAVEIRLDHDRMDIGLAADGRRVTEKIGGLAEFRGDRPPRLPGRPWPG